MNRVAGRFILMTIAVGIFFAATDTSQPGVRALALVGCPSIHCRYLPFIERAKPVTVAGLTWTSFRDGSFGAVGTVKNTTRDQPVYNVVVEVSFYIRSGSVLREATIVTTTLPATLPGQPNPFIAGTQMGGEAVSNVKASIKSYSLTSATNIVSQTLTFTPIAGSTDSLGTVINTTSYTVTNVIVVLWSPAVNNCKGIVTYKLLGTLKPKQSITFNPSICTGLGWPVTLPSGEVLASAQAVVVP